MSESLEPSSGVAIDVEQGPSEPLTRHERDRRTASAAHVDMASCLRLVQERTGKGFFKQVREMASLSFGPGKLTPDDYYSYRLYDDELFTTEEKRRFISDKRFHFVTERTCHPNWRAVTSDKIVSDTLLRSFGMPVPELVAVFVPGFRECGVPALRTAVDLAAFLRQPDLYPLFAKQINGVQSWGVWSLREFDPATDTIRLIGDETIAVEELAREISQVRNGEYMFQRTLETAPEIRAVTGPGLSTLRIVLILGDHGPEIIQWVWKVTSGTNPADNFWRSGNMLATLDFESGRVGRVIRGYGPFMEEVEHHPDTGQLLPGFVLPEWDRCKEMALHCACFCPKLGFQSYDLAITPDGPVVVEMNSGSAFSLFQLAYGKGFLTDRFQEFYRNWKHQDQPP